MTERIAIRIDGREITCGEGLTIMEAAAENGIAIPSLCNDERVKPYGACGLCVVEVESSPKLLRACSTVAQRDMKISTSTPRVAKARRAALELLLSDHKGDCTAPCKAACPAHTDCQGYVGLIANGERAEAAALIMEKLPLPASIGRVCPHPCESECRRALVEEPVNIAGLKTFAAENGLEGYAPEIKPDTGKSVSIIGGGPGGLSAAYFLRKEGHRVTVYDAMPKMGGMLRYGVPEYRLPKAVLDREIKAIEDMGVAFANNVAVGTAPGLSDLLAGSDAVVVAIGAWKGMRLNCPGERLGNVISGVEFLRDVSWRGDDERDASAYKKTVEGKRVAVVGGGDTAMDACRTAVRLGAEKVYDIYRRSLSEMPANETEKREAMEEGVIFKHLHDPIEIIDDKGDGCATHIRLQKMELGEPDESGRRKPVAVPGAEETLPVDAVIVMIGQSVAVDGFEQLPLTKKNTIQADGQTFETGMAGVFALGDATNKGAGIAIEAIGDAGRCAKVVHEYIMSGRILPIEKEILVTDKKTEEDFKERKKEARVNAKIQAPSVRRGSFKEYGAVLSEDEAKAEAGRCLECGCAGYFSCKLYKYANEYGADTQKYGCSGHAHAQDFSDPHMYRDMGKCILCGLCVRVCDEVMGSGVLGLMNRGFDTVVKPELNKMLAETSCTSCGQCAELCPTGAIGELPPMAKRVPLLTKETSAVCDGCGTGCAIKIHTHGRLRVKNTPEKGGLLCPEGRFGFARRIHEPRVETPMMRAGNEQRECSFEKAVEFIGENLAAIIKKHGAEAVGISVSDRCSNEEIDAIREFAGRKVGTGNVFTFNEALSEPVEDALDAVTQIKAGVNGRGLQNAGINAYGKTQAGMKALLMFGGYTGKWDLPDVEFLAVIDAYMSGAAGRADCALPAADFYETTGTYTNMAGGSRVSNAAIAPLAGRTNIEIIDALSRANGS